MTPEIWAGARERLQRQFSPEQITGRLRLEGVVKVSCWWIASDRAAGGRLYLHLRRRGGPA